MKNYITAILLAIFAIPSFGQSISIFDIDTTNFPTMKAKFYAFDKDGKQYKPNASELTITENGINRTITNVSCPNIPPYTLSVGIMVDTYGQIDLARKGVVRLVDFLYLPQDEIGITYMAKGVYIHQDFTKNKQKASTSAANIPSAPGVDVNAMFYSPKTGGIPFIKDRKSDKKILILVSDLHCPNLNINEAQLIADAKAHNINIYSVLLGSNDYTGLFNRIAKGSGGKVFERVSDENQITNIFQEIERIERYEPCELDWISDATCEPNITNVDLIWQGYKSTSSYLPTFKSIAKLKVSPNFIAFGKRSPNIQNDTTITLTAQNTDFIVTGINRKYGNTDFNIINTTFPFTIPKNSSNDITIRFEPSDSSLKYGSFEIETDKCLAYISANGGFPGKKSSSSTSSFKLTHPNGGEVFVAGSDTIISWSGVSPTDTVTLEYSIDSGKTWNLITEQGIGLKHFWTNVPKPSSSKCIMRIKQFNNGAYNPILTYVPGNVVREITYNPDGSRIAIGLDFESVEIWDVYTGSLIKKFIPNEPSTVTGLAYSPDGSRIATTHKPDGTAKIWDAYTGTLLKTLSPDSNQYYIDIAYSPDGNKVASGNSFIATLWDSNTGEEIRRLWGHIYNVFSVAFSPDGRSIATTSFDKTTKIWDVNSGVEIRTFKGGHSIYVNNIAFSPDGSRIVTASSDTTVKIWDVNSGGLISSLSGLKDFVTDIAYSSDGFRIATVSGDGKAKLWDANTGKLIRTINENDDDVIACIAFSPDGSRIATGCYNNKNYKRRNTIYIWDVDVAPLQQDISDSLFSIIAPQANFNKLNIDMGKVVLGQNKDTMITDVLCNIGAAPLHVLGVDVTNGNITDFMVPRGAGEFYLPPNECRPFMFDFMPTQLGNRNAKITVKSTIGDFVDTINITGEGIAPQLEIVNNLIDFGSVDIGSIKDTIQVVTIKNVGSAVLNINNSLHLGPNDIDFTTLSGAPPFSLNAGETAKMNLRFAPKAKGRTSGRLQFEFNGAGSPATVQLFGTGIGSNAIIKVGKDSAFTEEQVEIPVEMEIPNLLIQDGVTAISFELEMNKSILFPIGVNSTIDGDNRIIKFDSVPIKNVDVNEIAKLKFIATLGNAEETIIRVRNIIPIGNDADFDVVDGNFKLLGVCKEGGERFLSSSFNQTKLLSIAPNPATESIEIEYSNADEGTAEIIISNLLGQTILTQKLEKTQTGKTKLDLSQLPTGQYSILFKTETVLENRVIQVIK